MESTHRGIDGNASRSTAERWAKWVADARESPADIRTNSRWARFVGVSTATLGEICRLLHIRPHDARDLARMLRALTVSAREGVSVEAVLDVSDRRTLRKLIQRAAIEVNGRHEFLPEEFLERQRFIDPQNDGVRALRSILR